MAKTSCFFCGHEAVKEMTGDYHFNPPANVPGGEIVIADTYWFECTKCHEQILPPELHEKIDEIICNQKEKQ